jgi:oxygen-independent coproporphyrinogen-3 oxidase
MTMTAKALYIHVPFCRHICYYCDFCHFAYSDSKVERWLSALKKEMAERLDFIPKTIYIGGGTPTTLSATDLSMLLSHMEKNLDYSSLKEFRVYRDGEIALLRRIDFGA